jgi:trans-2,3-dihydro-3-hydroxyanthranilate isomerase
MHFYITDVFTRARYGGNQLATFLHDGQVSDAEMQQIAREMNFSETTFIMAQQPGPNGWPVRIFTPRAEVDFAGHPTLGTAYIIRQHLLQQPADQVQLDLRVGPVPVTFRAPPSAGDLQTLWMQQVQPELRPQPHPETMPPLLSLKPADLDDRWPILQVSTGLPFVIVPLRSLDALRRIVIARDLYNDLVAANWAKGILAFAPQGYVPGQTMAVRCFVDYLGIPEDPATGSANGCLAAYLARTRYSGAPACEITVGQGYEIGRPSELHLRARDDGSRIEVHVGGSVAPVAEGQWR